MREENAYLQATNEPAMADTTGRLLRRGCSSDSPIDMNFHLGFCCTCCSGSLLPSSAAAPDLSLCYCDLSLCCYSSVPLLLRNRVIAHQICCCVLVPLLQILPFGSKAFFWSKSSESVHAFLVFAYLFYCNPRPCYWSESIQKIQQIPVIPIMIIIIFNTWNNQNTMIEYSF